mgnify:FL=1
MSFIGREREVKGLLQVDHSKKSALTAIYGRRRVGKTALVEHAFSNVPLFKFEGIENREEAHQREYFRAALVQHFQDSQLALLDVSSWLPLLQALSNCLGERPSVIFFDEYQCLATESNALTSELKFAWDNFFLKKNRVHLILCGSISSFIVKEVIRSKALYGRIDTFIDLQPLSLPDSTVRFFTNQTPSTWCDIACVIRTCDFMRDL